MICCVVAPSLVLLPQVRSDPNLAKVRADKAAFKAVIDKYDEPIINEEALK